MRKCFLLKLNLRILAQLKVLIFVFPYNETHGRLEGECQQKPVWKTMRENLLENARLCIGPSLIYLLHRLILLY